MQLTASNTFTDHFKKLTIDTFNVCLQIFRIMIGHDRIGILIVLDSILNKTV